MSGVALDAFPDIGPVEFPQFIEKTSGSGCGINDRINQQALQRQFL